MNEDALAWGIWGRVSGNLREVTLDSEVAAYAAEYYDVYELVKGEKVEK